MSLVAVSLSHRTATLSELEHIAVRSAALGDLLSRMLVQNDILEVAVLSTCNRTEAYAWGERPERTIKQLEVVLEDFGGRPRGWVSRCSASHFGDAAIHHLFLVVSGLDSMVPGEVQIQGQVRETYRAAAELGSVGSNLHMLFRWALEAGKKARRNTGLADARRGLSDAAIETLSAKLGDLAGKDILLVGTGEMSGLAIETLRERGAEVRVGTRRMEASSAMAARLGVSAIPIEDVRKELEAMDAAVFATVAPHYVLTKVQASKCVSARSERPLLLVDLGLPRNVEPSVGDIPGIDLFDLERINAEGLAGAGGWDKELDRAKEIALEEARACADAFREKAAHKLVSHLQDAAEEVVSAELERVMRKVPDLDDEGKAAFESALRRAVRKVMHMPTVRAKEAASQGDEDVLIAARYLFGVTEDAQSDPKGARVSPGSRFGSEEGGADSPTQERERTDGRDDG